ncbi:hypothetical protein ACSBR2_030948 [Camellia fascicularis]
MNRSPINRDFYNNLKFSIEFLTRKKTLEKVSKVFPRESDPDYEAIEEAHYAYRVRDRLRREVLVPLHKALELPEVYMSAKQWELVPYYKIVASFDGHGSQVAELQWKTMVEDLSKKEGFKKGIAVCDVSGSMEGQLMNVCVALGLLVSELSEYPWMGKIITFNEKP